MVTSILTLASFVKVFQSGFLGPSREELASTREVPLTMIVGMSVLCLMILGLSLMPNWALSNLIEPAARDLVNQASYIQAVMGSGL
jgi:multicomponent Na+:H+ antiporter subunit D